MIIHLYQYIKGRIIQKSSFKVLHFNCLLWNQIQTREMIVLAIALGKLSVKDQVSVCLMHQDPMTTDVPKSRPGVWSEILGVLTCQHGSQSDAGINKS